jgi:hypothetical protein
VASPVQISGAVKPAILTVKVEGDDKEVIPSLVVAPVSTYLTPEPAETEIPVATTHPTNPDGADTCEGRVVPIDRDSMGKSRLFVNVYI